MEPEARPTMSWKLMMGRPASSSVEAVLRFIPWERFPVAMSIEGSAP